MRFLIAMPVRLGIARGMDWSQVDLDAGTLSIDADAVGNKGGKALVLPLTDLACDILLELPAREGLVFVGSGGGAVAAGSSAKDMLDERSGVTDWRQHDLRRTAATLTAERFTEFDESAFDLWLMHSRGGVHGVYQKAQRSRAMAVVARQWDSRLREILGIDAQSDVVKIA